MCLGRNIRKLFVILNEGKIKSNYWKKPNNLEREKLAWLNLKQI